MLGASTLPFLWNVFRSYRYGRVVTVDDPWGFGNSLEWATSCPPPRHNFTELPRIRSERPAFELHYPEYVERFREESHVHAGRGLRAARRRDRATGATDAATRAPLTPRLASAVSRVSATSWQCLRETHTSVMLHGRSRDTWKSRGAATTCRAHDVPIRHGRKGRS